MLAHLKTLLHGQRVSRGRVNPERGCGDPTRSRQTGSGRESDCDTLLSQRPGHFSKDVVLGRWIRTSRTCRGVGVSQGREELGRHSSLRLPWTTNNFRQLRLRPFIKSPHEQGVSRRIMSWETINGKQWNSLSTQSLDGSSNLLHYFPILQWLPTVGNTRG